MVPSTSRSTTNHLLVLSLVSKRWYAVVNSSPELWIRLDYPTSLLSRLVFDRKDQGGNESRERLPWVPQMFANRLAIWVALLRIIGKSLTIKLMMEYPGLVKSKCLKYIPHKGKYQQPTCYIDADKEWGVVIRIFYIFANPIRIHLHYDRETGFLDVGSTLSKHSRLINVEKIRWLSFHALVAEGLKRLQDRVSVEKVHLKNGINYECAV